MKMRLPMQFGAAAMVALTACAAAAQPPAAATAPVAASAASIARGKILVTTCAFCHGMEDYTVPYPTQHVPLIGGQHEAYALSALDEYAKGKRHFATMHAQAASLTQGQIEDIAAYIASVAPTGVTANTGPTYGAPSVGSIAAAAVFSRAPVAAASCVACHGKHGVSTNPEFPTLAGQYQDYLLQALKEYKTGERKNAIMNGVAASLSLADMKQLAAYFAKQHGPLKLLPKAGPD
ncbi:MAG TPA: c-type cytochrome [Gammaproteobacteria bacterium]|nr:c-type cytochrome [Gammaproteobacteria bacterium]